MRTLLATLLAAIAFIAPSAQTVTAHHEERLRAFAAEPPIARGEVVMLGNSLTEFGGDWQERLGEDAPPMRNRGIAGDDARLIARRLSEVTAAEPRAILLECGVNDISHGITAREAARGVCRLIDRIRREAPRTTLVVQSMTPINESTRRWRRLDGRSADIRRANGIIRGHCKAKGIAYVDLYEAMDEQRTGVLPMRLTTDGLHLSEAGYAVWAERIRPVVDALPAAAPQPRQGNQEKK